MSGRLISPPETLLRLSTKVRFASAFDFTRQGINHPKLMVCCQPVYFKAGHACQYILATKKASVNFINVMSEGTPHPMCKLMGIFNIFQEREASHAQWLGKLPSGQAVCSTT